MHDVVGVAGGTARAVPVADLRHALLDGDVLIDAEAVEEALARQEAWNRDLLDALPAAVYTTDAEGRITYFNRAAMELAGRMPTLGSDRWCVSLRLYTPDGTPLPHDQCPMAVALREDRPVRGAEAVLERPDGARIPFMPFPTPLHDVDGRLVGAVNMLVDISERKRAEDLQRILLDELNHRVKNTLATVQSLAAHTFQGDGEPAAMRRAFEARLMALSGAHNQLAERRWEDAELGAVVREVLAPYGGDSERVLTGGARIRLSARAAVVLAMTLHELATNAVRHGALSVAEGRLTVTWSAGGGELTINWREQDGPLVEAPTRRGFGARFIEGAAASELGGSATLDYASEGLACRITAKLHAL